MFEHMQQMGQQNSHPNGCFWMPLVSLEPVTTPEDITLTQKEAGPHEHSIWQHMTNRRTDESEHQDIQEITKPQTQTLKVRLVEGL